MKLITGLSSVSEGSCLPKVKREVVDQHIVDGKGVRRRDVIVVMR